MAPKITPRKRSTPRVESTEPSSKKPRKSATHRAATPRPEGSVKLVDGEMHITAQLSELVPVAQYANVTIGPVQLAWKLGNVDMDALLEVDWDQIEDSDDLDSKLTTEQRAAWDRVRQGLRSTMMLLEFSVAEDRMTVERAVAEYNRSEEAEKKKGPNSR